MPLSLTQTWQKVSQFRQPFRCMTKCIFYGFLAGLLFLVLGIPLLVFFGSSLKEDDAIKRVPAWIGLILAGTGLMAVIMGVTLCALILRLVNHQDSLQDRRHCEHGGVALLQPSLGSRPYPVDTVYAPTVYNLDSSTTPLPLYENGEKNEDRDRQLV